MSGDYDQWFELSIREFLHRISHTAPDQPPGAIGAVALALAAAAALARKSSDDATINGELDEVIAHVLKVAVLDGFAYDAWKGGDADSEAIERYPLDISALADRVAGIADAMAPNPITALTDIHTAEQIARGCARAAIAVMEGNANHEP